MIHGKPRWWKVLLKDPGSWLIIVAIMAMIMTSISIRVFEREQDSNIKKVKESQIKQ